MATESSSPRSTLDLEHLFLNGVRFGGAAAVVAGIVIKVTDSLLSQGINTELLNASNPMLGVGFLVAAGTDLAMAKIENKLPDDGKSLRSIAGLIATKWQDRKERAVDRSGAV